jgi:4-amino-4-deoxychorismate lyase
MPAPGNRGLHYGDGLFETLLCLHGRPLRWALHLARLRAGCERLGITPPTEDRLLALVQPLAREDGVVKLILTRGGEGRGYAAEAVAAPDLLALARPLPADRLRQQQEGIHARWCHARLARNPLLAGLKHLNRLEQVLARAEWHGHEIHEGLMLDSDGGVIEGVSSNLFIVQGGALLTPVLDQAGVAGVMRAAVMRAAATLGLPCHELRLTPAQVLHAEEVFATNAVSGLRPVRRLGRRLWPEPVLARRLQALLAAEEARA